MRPLIDLSSTAAKCWINVLETKCQLLFLLHPTFALIVAAAKAEAAAV